MLKSLVIASFALALSACATHPGFRAGTASFAEPDSFSILQERFAGSDKIVVKAEVIEANKSLVKMGKLFIGNKVFLAGISALSGTTFSWYVDTPCKNLPQGDNIDIRYEIYDASGTILQKNSIEVLAKISTC